VTQAAYYNVHGAPLTLSAKDAVLAREPSAYATESKVKRFGSRRAESIWMIRKGRTDGQRRASDRLIGDGANEESAWRHTLSRMRIQDEEEAAP
jgi:hypothetical protein